MSHIHIKLKDQSIIQMPQGSSAQDLALKLNLTGPHQAVGASVNGSNYDLSRPLNDGDQVTFWNFDDVEGKEIFWHTSAHILAQAILRIWPNAKPTIGPPIENGFYYDFADLTVSEEDLVKIENEMETIVKENYKTTREIFPNKQAALEAFKNNKYKCELIESFGDSELTAYRQGEFYDLCRGPHMPNIGKVKALKVLKTSGAYWRGDSNKEMLTRIYAITFPDRKLLKDYITQQEEAKKRDHKIIGPKLDLFSLHEEAPGMPFIHPKGMIIWNELLKYWRECHKRASYVEIKTPIMMSKELWETSGHWHNYRQNMYVSAIEEREFAIKPMNCPGGMLYYKTHVHSYRELPLRVGEIGQVHRHEASGALSGLFRVRTFHQDDAHIFMKPEDIQQEIFNVLQLVEEIYTTFGLTHALTLSTRPENDTIGSDQDWELTTNALKNALDQLGHSYQINEGDGAFYGPKIDIKIRDALGRTWQCATIQLDMALPERFQLEYVAADGSRPRPIMLHRVIYGSIERFFGILIEHFAGKFPLWISPLQVRLIPVADRHVAYANELQKLFSDHGLICDVDSSNESVSKKVREAQINQINYMLTVGDRELENRTANLRTRDNHVHGEIQIDEFLKKISQERDSRSLNSVYASAKE